MALYITRAVDAETGKELIRSIGRLLGIEHLDANMLADDDGITPLTVIEGDAGRATYPTQTGRSIGTRTVNAIPSIGRTAASIYTVFKMRNPAVRMPSWTTRSPIFCCVMRTRITFKPSCIPVV